jgi:hypothetical protein
MLPAEKIKLIESCLMKAVFNMFSDYNIINEFRRLANEESKRRLGCPEPKDWSWRQSSLGFKFRRSAQLDQMSRFSIEYDHRFLCAFDCDYSDERYGCIIRYKTIEKAAELGICILYYEGKSDTDVFEYSGDGLNTELVFKPIVNRIRNTINYDLYQQFPKISGTVESKEETMDTETKATAIKPGLTTKEVFVLDQKFFKSGDIYLLHISPEFHGDIHSGTALAPDAHLPAWVYAICSDTNGGTVIEFMFKPKEPLVGIDDLVWIQVHAEDIENGVIEVTRKLCNEALMQNEGYNRYEG